MNTPYPALFEPLAIGHLRLKNRIMSTSHAPAYAEDGAPKERYRLYHEEKAKGGLALSMFGGSSTVSVDSPPPFGQIDLGDDRVIPWLRALAEGVHRHGCATMIQITHMGRRTGWSSHGWLPTIAPSAVREPAHRSFPKAMDRDDIDRVIGDFAAAAGRAQRGGLDGCELSVLGHLGGQFWSPAVNRRTDGYGGSPANRARFTLETLEAMRERAPDRFLIGMRFTMDELLEGGLHEDDAMEIVRLHVEAGLVDFLNVTVGTSFDHAGLSFTVPNMSHPIAPHLDRVKRIRDAFGVPVFHANRVADLASANRAVKEGCVDMIGMTRAHIADPHLVAKLARGEEHRVRTCVGAGYCIDRIYVGADALCLQNPATGRERTMPHVIGPSPGPRRKVVVVGAGPAGLEAARVCASRGHDVVLFEAADAPGGQVRLAARATWRRDLIGIVQWLAREGEELGIDLRLGAWAEVTDVLGEAPDIVIVATGGLPDTECLEEGAEHVTSLWDVLGGQTPPGSNVLLFDDHGDHQGPSGAEFLAGRGAKVELATPDRSVAFELGATNFSVHLKHLYRAGVVLTPDVRLASVRPKGNALEATLRNVYSGETSRRTVDQVVVEHGTVPATELFDALRAQSGNRGRTDADALARGAPQPLGPPGSFSLFRVGDAVASRNIHAALFDALRICKDL
ncbi:MAG: NADH:flavin oxidoreductase [Thiotrichales bacterium]|nr:NADH:flavin oxidoreductase [Thiotrichales bacterium]